MKDLHEKKNNSLTNSDREPPSTKLLIEFNFVSRRLRFLIIAIILGIIIIFLVGTFSPALQTSGESKIYIENFYYLKIISLVVCIIVCISSYPLKNFLLKKVTEKKFMASYFNAIIFPMALCDFGGLFCIVTNSFFMQDFIYSVAGLIISLLYIFLNFPSTNDLRKINFA